MQAVNKQSLGSQKSLKAKPRQTPFAEAKWPKRSSDPSLSALALRTLWPTQIYKSKLVASSKPRSRSQAKQKLISELLRETLIIREIDEEGQAWSKDRYVNGFTSYASWDDLHLRFAAFEELEKALRPHVRKFARALNWDLGAGHLEMSTCWVNVMPPDCTHSWHIHPQSVISGTVYISTPPSSSPIKFEDPRHDRMMNSPPRRQDAHPQQQRQQPHIAIKPEAGEVILFESWLRHEVPISKARRDRISVSFNYSWRNS
jgi:uncharacterized protein (TIGR02466 family)